MNNTQKTLLRLINKRNGYDAGSLPTRRLRQAADQLLEQGIIECHAGGLYVVGE